MADKQTLNNVAKNAAGLDIGATVANAETNNAIAYKIGNTLYAAALDTDIDLSASTVATGGALAITTANSNIVTIVVDSAGAITSYVGTQGATIGAVVPYKLDLFAEAIVGYIIIENATGSDFTIGTTSLAAASTTVTYVDASGVDPLA